MTLRFLKYSSEKDVNSLCSNLYQMIQRMADTVPCGKKESNAFWVQ